MAKEDWDLDGEQPQTDFRLKLSPEDTKQLLEYMAQINKLIDEEPPRRSSATGPTKKWTAWHDKVEALNREYRDLLENFEVDCSNLSWGAVFAENGDYAALIRDHLYAEDDQLSSKQQSPHLEKISKVPTKYVMPNTNLTQSLPGRFDPNTGEKIPIIGAGWFDLPALTKPKEITNYTCVDFSDDGAVTVSKDFTEQDLCNFNAICSLYEAGNTFITAKMVHHAKSNQANGEFVDPETEKKVEESIEKMRHIFIKCDLSSEVSQRNKEARRKGQQQLTLDDGTPADSFKIDDLMLNLRKGTARAKNIEVTGFYIEAMPILLEHAKITGQLITVPAKMLDIKEVTKDGYATTVSIANTSFRQPIKEYLLRRIAEMKRNKRNRTKDRYQTILYETLYRRAGVDSTIKQYTKNARDYAHKCLDFWVATGYITGYVDAKRGRQIYSVEIEI